MFSQSNRRVQPRGCTRISTLHCPNKIRLRYSQTQNSTFDKQNHNQSQRNSRIQHNNACLLFGRWV